MAERMRVKSFIGGTASPPLPRPWLWPEPRCSDGCVARNCDEVHLQISRPAFGRVGGPRANRAAATAPSVTDGAGAARHLPDRRTRRTVGSGPPANPRPVRRGLPDWGG